MKIAIPFTLLIATVASAQDDQRPPVPIHFNAASIDIMPGLTGGQRYQLKRFLNGAFKKVRGQYGQLKKLNDQIRKTKNKDARKKLTAQKTKLQGEIAKSRKQGRAFYDKIGIKPEQLKRLNHIPRGVLYRERYNHAVMLESPDLTPKQERIVRCSIAGADAAQRTLWRQQSTIDRTLADQDVKVRQRLKAEINNRIRAIEKRFWQAMYFALAPEQMAATRPLRSPRYKNPGDNRNQLYLLEGLTPSQMVRVNSLLEEMNSEAAADTAAINAFNRTIRAKDGPKGKERQAVQKQLSSAYKRRGEIYSTGRKLIRELMNEAQYAEWESIPPFINAGERSRSPMQTFKGIELHPEQMAVIGKLAAESRRETQAAQKKMREESKELRESGLGPDSPQMMMMTTMNRGLQGDRARISRRLGNRLCEDVVEGEQIALWIANP